MCDHPSHGLDHGQRLMLETAVRTVQTALWGHHPPTVFGNNPSMLTVARSLADLLAQDGDQCGATVHHAKDGCFHVHFPSRAFLWADHLKSCPASLDCKGSP